MNSHDCEVRGYKIAFRDLLSSRQFGSDSICHPSGTPGISQSLPSAEALRYAVRSLRDGLSRTLGIFLVIIAVCGTAFAAPSGTPAARKQQARTQFETAERMREALNGRPESERTRKDYQKVADAYRKVYYVAPASSKADASVMAVAEILAEMGRQFAPDDKDLQAAIGQYEFLRREYPSSRYRAEALFTIGQIYKEDLGDEATAKATFEEFLKKYPHNQLAPKAQDALAEMRQPKSKKKTEEEAKIPAIPATDADTPPAKAPGATRVTGIRYWSTADYTRVAIDLDSEVKYEAGRVPDPDRIFFDLPDTRLVSTLVGKSFDVQDGFLKKIRVAQYQKGSTRVVLEVDDVTEYSAFLLPNPYRLIIDIHGKNAATTEVAAAPAPDEKKDVAPANGAVAPSQSPATVKLTAPATATANSGGAAEGSAKAQPKPVTGVKPQADAKTESASATTPAKKEPAPTTTAFKTASGELKAEAKSEPKPPATATRAEKPTDKATDKAKAEAEASDDALAKATTKPTTAPTAVTVVADKKSNSSKKSAKGNSGTVQTTHVAAPTAEGDRSLIRALGIEDWNHRDRRRTRRT